ncbi:MAG: DUF2723 domain-containing protein [Gemmatimonadota bacterium]
MSGQRRAYVFAVAAALVIFGGYLSSLAPTVTFWDAGEFIAAARTLGIPHPPGTPLFVLIAHVWGALVPIGEYAYRLNVLSALFSAAGGGFIFLLVYDTLASASARQDGSARPWLCGLGAMAAAAAACFTFTQWQNSNETEVYAVATAMIAALAWLCFVWRRERDTPRGVRILLLMLYLGGLAIGCHLLSLLAGPAIVMFMASVLIGAPAPDAGERRAEWARLSVVAGTWALLIGGGLGSTSLVTAGAILVALAIGLAIRGRVFPFALAALAVATIGMTTYFVLYIRSGLHPVINEAAPDNFRALLEVLRRAQYPVRTPLDDPTIMHGADNPGRTLTMFGWQLLNYGQYFDWQWANGIRGGWSLPFGELPWRTAFTLLFFWLGTRGFLVQRRVDRSGWILLSTLFLTTGFGLLVYMNFKPGYSVGYPAFPDPALHEVRDRDYFFVVSFVVWGIWAGLALAMYAIRAVRRPGLAGRIGAGAVLSAGLLPFLLNYPAASRRSGPDARLAADFSYDLLNSVPPYGILFTYGDNDTFPLWWAQEIAGIRRDVSVVCLALAQTDWYMRELRDAPVRPFEPSSAPPLWQGRSTTAPTWPLHSMTNAEVDAARPVMLPSALTVQLGPVSVDYPARTVLMSNDILVLRIIQQNLGRRPIAWATTTGRDFHGLDRYVVQRGLVYELRAVPSDSSTPAEGLVRVPAMTLDVPTTEQLVWHTYRYAGLEGSDVGALDPTSQGIARTLATPFAQLALASDLRHDTEGAIRNLARASRLSPNATFTNALRKLEASDSTRLGP